MSLINATYQQFLISCCQVSFVSISFLFPSLWETQYVFHGVRMCDASLWSAIMSLLLLCLETPSKKCWKILSLSFTICIFMDRYIDLYIKVHIVPLSLAITHLLRDVNVEFSHMRAQKAQVLGTFNGMPNCVISHTIGHLQHRRTELALPVHVLSISVRTITRRWKWNQ